METETAIRMRNAHRVLTEIRFEPKALHRGYADRTLRIDLSSGKISSHPVDEKMKALWTGGKGFDLWMMFKEIDKNTRWDSPENPICFSSGPLGGTTSFPGAGKTLVTTISPLTHSIMDCNVGGYFGPYLKFAGFDALMLTGKASEEVIVFIDAVRNVITIETAPLESIDAHLISEELTEMYADNELERRNISVVSAGRAADHTRMGVLNFSFYDWRRKVARIKQAGRGGIGTVFRNKKMKALVIKSLQVTPAWRIVQGKVSSDFEVDGKSCEHLRGQVREICSKWRNDPEYVIEMMQDIQDQQNYISKTAVDEICALTGTPRSHLYHIATFYKAFSLRPRGQHVIQVCVGTACHVKGAAMIVDAFERELGIKRGQTTSDGVFTLEAVACLGCCSLAPVVKVGDDIFGNVQVQDVAGIIQKQRRETHDTDR